MFIDPAPRSYCNLGAYCEQKVVGQVLTSPRNLLSHDAAYTLQLDGDNKAIRVTDSKVRARDLFVGHNQLPKLGGSNPLKDAWNGGYAVEIFYFPASSLKITNILRYLLVQLQAHSTDADVHHIRQCFAHDHMLGSEVPPGGYADWKASAVGTTDNNRHNGRDDIHTIS